MMESQAQGTFDVALTPPTAFKRSDAMTIGKGYRADIEGTGDGQMLTAVRDSAGYSAHHSRPPEPTCCPRDRHQSLRLCKGSGNGVQLSAGFARDLSHLFFLSLVKR
jgi:hypothetical protein